MPDLPPEILGHIIDLLSDQSWTLEACCLVSKSWIPLTRKHLFFRIRFDYEHKYLGWKKAFPDPTNSPAHFVRSLQVLRVPSDIEESGWTWSSFCRVESLDLYRSSKYPEEGSEFSLSAFRGFSPSVKYLTVRSGTLIAPDTFDLIRSFPFLEDLTFNGDGSLYDDNQSDGPQISSTSPVLTGTLRFSVGGALGTIIGQFLKYLGQRSVF